VIEHVANPLEFCESLSALTAPNGATVVSTINRSMRAYTKVAAVKTPVAQAVLVEGGLPVRVCTALG